MSDNHLKHMSKDIVLKDLHKLMALHITLRANENERDSFLTSLESVLWTTVLG